MSGRLIITTKKSYCPWNAANVERVLRDERLERERLERQQSEENQSLKRQHEHEEGVPQGHINLFPEAREAEIRLTHGSTDDIERKNSNNGVMPVPLGGDELNNRKNGKVPFYMRAQSQSEQQQKYYDNSAYRGIHRNRSGAATSDEITDNLMRDQFASREEYRKQQNDPMNRFYVDSRGDNMKDIYAERESSSRPQHDMRSNCNVRSPQELMHSFESQSQERGLTKSRERKSSHRTEGVEDNDDDSEASSSSTSSKYYRRRKRMRKHDSKKERSSKHSSSSHYGSRHRRKNSPPHSKKKRRKDKKTKKKHRSKARVKDEGDRHERQHSASSPCSPTSNMDLKERKESDTHELDDMRRRRHAREAREMERQRQIMR